MLDVATGTGGFIGELRFPDSSFDLVCLVRALHHMTDNTQPQALAEMYRVLKPGGRFFVAEMYRDGQTEAQMTDVLLHHWTAALETATRPPPSGWVHRETFTRSEVIRMVQGVPLRNLQLHDIASLGPDDDPLNPGRINYQEFCLDRSLRYLSNRPEPVPGNAALRDRAEVLRQRLHTVGINSATLLVAVGIK